MADVTERIRKIAEGREAEIFAWDGGTVLRLFREARPAASLESEMAAMQTARSVVPLVPAVSGITEVMGRPGLIMERVDGPDLIALIAKKPWTLWSGGRVTGRVHAQLHAVIAPEGIPSLKSRISRLADQAPPEWSRHAEFVLRELETLPDGDRLCHGDFHPGNIIMTNHGPVVIDWPNVTRGDPTADFARTRLILRIGALPPGTPFVVRTFDRLGRRLFAAAYLRAYRRERPVDMTLAARWEVVRAADRLADGIAEERPALLKILEDAMASRS